MNFGKGTDGLNKGAALTPMTGGKKPIDQS